MPAWFVTRRVVAGGFTDNFNRANGPLGSPWVITPSGAAISISSNRATFSTNGIQMTALVNLGASGTYSTKVYGMLNTFGGWNPTPGLMVLATSDGQNGYFLVSGWNTSNADVRYQLLRITTGTQHLIQRWVGPPVAADGDVVSAVITPSGGTATVDFSVNGVLAATVLGATIYGTYGGLRGSVFGSVDQVMQWDDFAWTP